MKKKILQLFFWVLAATALSLFSFPTQLKAQCGYVDQQAISAATKCSARPSMLWDCGLNRCMRRPESKALRDRFKKCQNISDNSQRKQCFDKVAKLESGQDGADFTDKAVSSGAYDTVLGATVGLAAINFFVKDDKGGGSSCLSKNIFLGGAVTGLLGELYNYVVLGKKLKKLTQSYRKKTVSENSYDGQVKAFEYLKKEQETIAKTAKSKAILYNVIAAVYAATAVVAIAETSGLLTPQCFSSTPKKQGGDKAPATKKAPTSFLNSAFDKLFQNAYAKDVGGASKGKLFKLLIGAGVGAVGGYFLKGKPQFTSYAIIGLSGIAAFLSYKLAAAASEQKKLALKNAKIIEDVIAEFKESNNNSCPEGRDDIRKPECFCYIPGSGKNQDRANSETCQAHWARNEKNYDIKAHDYKKDDQTIVGCLTVDQRFDKNCQCKKFKDTDTGINACFKAPSAMFSMGNFGNNISANELKQAIDNASQGDAGLSQIDSGQAEKFAAKSKKTLKRALATFNQKRAEKGSPPLLLGEKSAMDFVKNKVNPALLASAGGSGAFGPKASALPPGTGLGPENLKKALAKVSLKKIQYSGGAKFQTKGAAKKKGFSFMSGEDTNSGQGKNINFLKKEYDFEDNDIVKGEGVSLWKVLSKRYTTTGLRKLFEDAP